MSTKQTTFWISTSGNEQKCCCSVRQREPPTRHNWGEQGCLRVPNLLASEVRQWNSSAGSPGTSEVVRPDGFELGWWWWRQKAELTLFLSLFRAFPRNTPARAAKLSIGTIWPVDDTTMSRLLQSESCWLLLNSFWEIWKFFKLNGTCWPSLGKTIWLLERTDRILCAPMLISNANSSAQKSWSTFWLEVVE